MSNDLEDSDEEYFTPNEDEILEVPGRKLQGPKDADGNDVTFGKEKKPEMTLHRLHEPEEASGGASSVDLHNHRNDIRLLLVGKTGHGKSATANSILGLQKGTVDSFLEKMSSMSVTRDVQRKKGERFGRRIEVVDCPGFCDTHLTEEQLCDAIFKAIAFTVPGFTAIGFVLKPERFTAELVETVKIFLQFFGKNVKEFAFIILTHTTEEKSVGEYLTEGHEYLEKLKSLCTGGETVLIDNKSNDAEKEKQVRRIIDELENIEQKNGNTYFTNDVFEETTRLALKCICEELVEKTEAISDETIASKKLEVFKGKVQAGSIETFVEFIQHPQVQRTLYLLLEIVSGVKRCVIM